MTQRSLDGRKHAASAERQCDFHQSFFAVVLNHALAQSVVVARFQHGDRQVIDVGQFFGQFNRVFEARR